MYIRYLYAFSLQITIGRIISTVTNFIKSSDCVRLMFLSLYRHGCGLDERRIIFRFPPETSGFFFFWVRLQNCENLLLASSFLSSIRLPAWNNSASIGGIFKKFDTYEYFFKYGEKIQVLLQSDNNNKHFTCRPIYIFDHILLIST